MFKGEIFLPRKKPFLNLTLSEKLSWGSLLSLIFYCFFLLADEKWNSSEITNFINDYTQLNQLVGVAFAIAYFSSIFLRFKEFENLNGEFKGKLIIDENSIVADDKIYELSKIQDFYVEIIDFYGKRTHNTRSGPYYFQGVSNKIRFKYDDKGVVIQFQIYSEKYIYDLNWTILNIVCKQKIPFQKEYFKLFSKDYKDTPTYNEFLNKLIKDNVLTSNELKYYNT